MKVFSATDVGRKRKINQDYVFVSASPMGNLPNLFVVADGMGGHNAGDYASSHAVETLVGEVISDQNINAIKIIRHAVEAANTEILARARDNISFYGMGTTLVLSTIVGHYIYVANVGDSRLYLIRDQIRQVTVDHSLVQEMVYSGEIKAEEMRTHPEKNVITRAIGAEDLVEIDFFDVEIKPGDYILMCSDGLTNMVEDQRIEALIHSEDKSLEEKGQSLIDEANANGGKDNIAVILIEL
ncbi:MAG: Stp1/IreP family PP2C-type Ser/Thr phosphatase [Blautia sp.]|nr:Stp1/IreP family PP2C-type Ser/Thr phosphatase [Blautia sp.]